MQEEIQGKICKSNKEKEKTIKKPARMRRVHILVYGIVQGVFFRQNTKLVAGKLNLKGFVKNLKDNSVEVVAEGEDKNVEKLIEFLKKGPEDSKVERIELKEEKPKNEFEGFEIRL